MRLYLTIQRHGLPVTRILWTTASAPAVNTTTASANSSFTSASSATLVSTRAPNASFGATGGCTIAQLLEDVNEVVPLETDNGDEEVYGAQWGLEDYTVEIGGYECLHFMEIDGLLRDGDEVLIRALQTSDLKARRLTGRHQISTDGRHLIDGIPFGKPYFQRSASSRPPITIPPRKRRRLAIGGWDGEAEDDDDGEYTGVEDDGNFDETTGKELALFHPDSSEESSMDEYDAEEASSHEDREQTPVEGEEGEVSLNDELQELEKESRQAAGAAGDSRSGSLKRRRQGLEMDQKSEGEMRSAATSDQARMSSRMRPKDKKSAKRSHSISSSEVSPQSSLQSSSPGSRGVKSSIALSTPQSRKQDRNGKPSTISPSTSKSVRFQKLADIGDGNLSSEEKTADSESEEHAAESSVSGSRSDSDSESASVSSNDSDRESVSSSSSSSDSSTSSSDSSDGDVSSSESEAAPFTPAEETPPSKKRKMNAPPKVNPPGYGAGSTKSRNRRGSMRRRLVKMKSLGLLHPEANFADLRDWDATHGDARLAIAEREQEDLARAKDQQSEFEAKRQQLLRDLADGGVNAEGFTDKENVPPQSTEDGVGVPVESAKDSVQTPTAQPADSNDETLSESASKRRRLDVAGSRRLLFGSLGVRTPKTKEDEEDTRKKLTGKANDAQIASQKTFVPDHADDISVDAHADEFDGNWEEKLLLKATECVHDNVPLSTPPFPFVQRWDEDAQATIRARKGIKKSRKRKRKSYYSQEEQAEDEDTTGYFNGDDRLDYDDAIDGPSEQLISQTNEPAADDLPIRSAGEVSGDAPAEDDLPPLPYDLSDSANLTKADLKTGAVVAFKQIDMSRETNWQPEVSDYRVAAIDKVDDDTIKLCLSRRDRNQPRSHNDEDGGPRVYSGFEMPGYDDEGDAEDDGLREVSFDQLIEPKLLRGGDIESSEPPEVVAETQDVSLPPTQHPKPVDVEVGPISSPTRDNISQLIQDAGFRSKIDSDLMGSQEKFRFDKSAVERASAGGLESLDEVEGEDREESAVPSPAFSGFLSSPPREMGGNDGMDVDNGIHNDLSPGEDSENPVAGDDSLLDKMTVPESTKNTTPRDSIPSGHPKSALPSDDGLHFTSDIRDESTLMPESEQNGEPSSIPPSFQKPPVVEESLLENRDEEQDEDSVNQTDQTHSLAQESENMEVEIQPEPSQANQVENGEEGGPEDGDGKSPLEEEPFQDTMESFLPQDDSQGVSQVRPLSRASSTVTNPLFVPDEDSQFDSIKPLEDILPSTAPVRRAKSPKPTPDSKGKRRAFSSPGKEASSPASNTGRSPSPELPPANNSSPKPEPEPSQAVQGQQSSIVVDLTLTSDPVVSPGGSDGEFVDSSGLPRGPGWVQKRSTGGGARYRQRYGREELSPISPPRPRRRCRGRPRKYP